MLPFKLVLIFQLTSIGLAYWVCDLAGTTCDADDGTRVCFAHFGNSYVTSHEATLFQIGSRLKCAALCLQKKNCRCIVFLKEKGCVLLFTTTPSQETSGLMLGAGQEIATGKPTYSTPHYNALMASNAVDNVWYGSWYQSEWAVKSWWLVDLGQNYVISEMKINFSNKKNTDNMHVKVGHTLKTDGDFSSYDLVAVVPAIHPQNGHWFLARPSTKEQYRYVSIQIQGTQLDYLVIHSVQVFTNY